ncbi:mixed lineage kinase domain-like protein [Gastrophryne carolinensis]
MEVLGQVLSVAQTIYDLCDQASSNKQQCHRLCRRIQMLLKVAESLERQPEKSAAVRMVVEEFAITLENAKCWVIKYSHSSWWRKVLQANSIKEEFGLINDRLGDTADALTGLLSAEHRHTFHRYFTEYTRRTQNQKDIEKDLKDMTDQVDKKMDNMTDDIRDLSNKMSEIQIACRPSCWNINEIRGSDLKLGDLMLERPTHFLYRGEYHRSPVAIKVFKGQSGQNEDYIRKTFQSESQTMKKFECPNILRLYGICIDNSGPETIFSLVMELCSKGTLRELLNEESELDWDWRVRMALDAARALYRLHQTEVKAILHGSLSSSKFLVDGTYCLKLSGFELSKTESSIRKPGNAENAGKSREREYTAPEVLESINAYDKRSEIYSLGVVMFEIATGKRPFQGLEVTLNNLGQMQEQWWAGLDAELPPSCPRPFRDLIKRLLQKNPEDRPSAGGPLDKNPAKSLINSLIFSIRF